MATTAAQNKPVSVASRCLAIVLQRVEGKDAGGTLGRSPSGHKLLQAFQEENGACFWNPALVECVGALELSGFVKPGTLLVSGSELHLECLRGAWARRVLKPPRGYAIRSLGDVGQIEMHEVPQTQFVPLPEVLCLLISNLNGAGQPATLEAIVETLHDEYAGMAVPRKEILFATLSALEAEGKVYCMGNHYFVSTANMFQQYQSNFANSKPISWTNDAAPYYMSGAAAAFKQESCSRECQTGASIVNGPPAMRPTKRDQATNAEQTVSAPKTVDAETQPQPTTNGDAVRRSRSLKDKEKEKHGFFARIFRQRSKSRDAKSRQKASEGASGSRGGHSVDPPTAAGQQKQIPSRSSSGQPDQRQPSAALGTFSVQFPPTEWLHDPRYLQQQQAAAAGFFKGRRTRDKTAPPAAGKQGGWTAEPKNAPVTSRRRHAPGNLRFGAPQRYCTFPENMSNHASPQQVDAQQRAVKARQKHARSSKYMSSSSECVQYLGTVDQPPFRLRGADAELTGESAEARNRRRAARRADRRAARGFASPDVEFRDYRFDLSPGYRRGSLTPNNEVPTPRQMPLLMAPLAAPTDTNLDTTTESIERRTSTPADDERAPLRLVDRSLTDEVDLLVPAGGGGGQQVSPAAAADEGGGTGGQNNSDSAFSPSSLATDLSSGDSNKYSSWSGSEGQAPGPQQQQGGPKDPLDHTYINLDHRQAEIPAVERARAIANEQPYPQESTIFENESERTINLRDFDQSSCANLEGAVASAVAKLNLQEATCKPVSKEKLAPTLISGV